MQLTQQAYEALVEELAAVEHQRWSHWQDNVHRQSTRLPDGSALIPAPAVERWDRQIAAPYSELSEAEKQSDRDQVERYLSVVLQRLGIECV